MKFAVNPATTMEYDIEADLKAYHAAGIRHMELWIPKLKKYLLDHELADFQSLLTEHDIEIVGACAMGNLPVEDIKSNAERLKELKFRLGICQSVNCPAIVITPGELNESPENVHELMVRNLRSACEVAGEFGVKLALEFLQGNSLIGTLGSAKEIVRSVADPHLGLIIDCAHFWMDRSDLSDLEDLKADELLLVHLADIEKDVRPEAATDNDRTFPGRGKGIERKLIPAIQATGYNGFWSLELFNKEIWAHPIEEITAEISACFEHIERSYPSGQ